jgi:hypothetical protein
VTSWEQGRPDDGQRAQDGRPYGDQPYSQPPYGQAPSGQQPYGPQYGQPSYGQGPYGQPQSQVPYGQAPYGQAPAWGPGPGWQQPAVWPYGPGRPGLATASAVLAIVTGSLTVVGGLVMLLVGVTGDGDTATWLLSLGLPVGGVLLAGGIGLLGRRRADWVLWSAVAAVAVLVSAMLGAALTLDSDSAVGVLVLTVMASVLPIVTAALSSRSVVREWAAAQG